MENNISQQTTTITPTGLYPFHEILFYVFDSFILLLRSWIDAGLLAPKDAVARYQITRSWRSIVIIYSKQNIDRNFQLNSDDFVAFVARGVVLIKVNLVQSKIMACRCNDVCRMLKSKERQKIEKYIGYSCNILFYFYERFEWSV